jgi:hypothetical protein
MAKAPKPPKPVSWAIHKIVAKQTWMYDVQ